MWKIHESNKSSYQCVKQYRCLHSCSNPCTGWSRTFLRCSWADSDTWPPDERWGSSCRRSDTEVHRVLMVALQRRNSIIGKDFSKTRFFFSYFHQMRVCADLQNGDCVGVGLSTHVPLLATYLLGQVHTGPLGLSRHSHSHFFLSHGLVTETKTNSRNLKVLKSNGWQDNKHTQKWLKNKLMHFDTCLKMTGNVL